MKKFRLALVRQQYRPDGGAERFVSYMLSALAKYNLDLNLITREWLTENHSDWHIHLCNPHNFGRISREHRFAKAARALWQDQHFDLVQSHERIAGCDIYRAGDGLHSNWLQQRARVLPKWRHQFLFGNPYHRYVMKTEAAMYAAPKLKAIICNAQMIKKEIIAKFQVPAEKISVIYNAIDNDRFQPADEVLRQRVRQHLQLPKQAHCLIFVGSGFERKGLSAAIQAVSTTRSYLLVLGQDKHEKKYRALASACVCRDRVLFMGIQKNTLPFYQAADGLLLPTLYDPFPNVILEAMACGLPVITSHSCGGAEFITAGKNGFITDALDISGLTAAIQELPRQAVGSSMAEFARNTILPYNPANLSRQLVELYKRFIP